MLIRYADWVRPTDGALRFVLRAVQGRIPGEAGFTPSAHAIGVCTPMGVVARAVLTEDGPTRFEARISRWSGPEDVRGSGQQPYLGTQDSFEELPWRDRLSRAALEPVLEGRAVVMRSAARTDYLLRDHHMLDVALYHYLTTGELPRRLLHADRHSDWCSDSFLAQRTPLQAATWWKLLEGLKRAEDGSAVVEERDVHFIWARAVRTGRMSGRDLGDAVPMPSWLSPEDCAWERVLEREEARAADWVSLDLDYFQPRAQLAAGGGLLRDPRFGHTFRQAKVRVFVLSPQFTNGGDKVEPWTVQGSLASSVRLLNLLRAPG
jgi:hypothetical protein